MKKISFISFIILFCIFLLACTAPHECHSDTWVLDAEFDCEEEWTYTKYCDVCGKIIDEKSEFVHHDYYTVTPEGSCTERQKIMKYCHNCDYQKVEGYVEALGHDYGEYVITKEATVKNAGTKTRTCNRCGEVETMNYFYQFSQIGFSTHGKLSVNGTHLVDQNGDIFQLMGLSTHGLQWYGNFVDYDVIKACKETFNINVLRLSLYTAERGYCETSGDRKEALYQLVCKGIDIATSLDMYAIVDWHMLGEEDANDRNPLYYKEEAKEFFNRITLQYQDHDNILYEICNEPCGSTTWADIKEYANEVIPVIRNNKSDAIVLVGCPKWSSDLASVQKSPLTGYENIMYTYHFYAADIKSPRGVKTAVSAGLPVFITEHGGMDADGDGAINRDACSEWYKFLNANSISFVAWNLSNSNGSSAIMKHGAIDHTDFSDSNLKDWGIYYKNIIRARLIELYGE